MRYTPPSQDASTHQIVNSYLKEYRRYEAGQTDGRVVQLLYASLSSFLDLHSSISNDIVSTKIYDKRDDFDFEIVNFPILDGDVPRSTSYGVYLSQLIRFARASIYVADFNTRNKLLAQKLLKQGYRYH